MSQQKDDDLQIVQEIIKKTSKKNKDNVSRTDAYFKFFKANPEIKWSFLASMVSRNGGYNICDLQSEYFVNLIEFTMRKRLFLTYERANWLIFQDVFPQLLIYEYSTKFNYPLFHLLKYFQVSMFIQQEWEKFWLTGDENRLTTSLIINEQNVIQKPIIEHHLYKNKIFHSFLYYFEDWFHFSSVLFPTRGGEIYGASANGFRNLNKRIDLGKRLADILFQPRLFPHFFDFAEKQPHTGSRYDYEQFFEKKAEWKTPILRAAFPIVNHHVHEKIDWSLGKKISTSWLNPKVKHKNTIYLSEWYEKKQKQMKALVALNDLIK